MSVGKNFLSRHSLVGFLLSLRLLQTVLSDTQWPPFQNHEGQAVNISKLISVAKSVLGVESFCNTSTDGTSSQLTRICSCSERCVQISTCCPDNPYSYIKKSCLNIAIFPHAGLYQLNRRMVDVCPYQENHPLPICRAEKSRSTFDVPVTSKRTGLSYVHRLCALCSLEKDNDLESWGPVVAKCESPNSEITDGHMDTAVVKQLLANGECVLVYNEPQLNSRICIPSIENGNYEDIVGSCNVSGLWERYDPDIVWACEHYTTPFEQFANVFCYICNPDLVSHTSGPIIDTCNVTGYWKANDVTIEQRCLHYANESRFYPFKNVFCYMCNMWDSSFINYNSAHQLPLIQPDSMRVYALETYSQERNEFVTKISFGYKYVTADYLNNKAVDEFRYECEQGCLKNSNNDKNNFNVRTVCQCNTRKICESNPEGKQLLYCIPDTFGSSYYQQNFYLVLGVCLFANISNDLKQKCEDPDKENIIENVPGILSNDIMFRNLYCSKCNGYSYPIILDIHIFCSVYIDARLTLSLERLIKLSVHNSCKIQYVNNKCNNVQKVMTPSSTHAISACNTTGFWDFEDEAHDILYGCEQDLLAVAEKLRIRSLKILDQPFEEFKNIYCYVCNPYKSYPLYTKCNMSTQWERYDVQMEYDCENGRRDSKWGPFKNFHCFKCNQKGNILQQVSIIRDVISILVHQSYRYVFRISPNTLGELARNNADPMGCHQKSEETTMTCEDTYCAKGKILINDSCDYPTESSGAISLYGVYYSVTLSDVRMETVSAINQASLSISEVHNATLASIWDVHKAVFQKLNEIWASFNASIQIEVFESWTNASCMEPTPVYFSYKHEIKMLIYSELLVTSLRMKKKTFETILLENKTFHILFDQKSFEMNVVQDYSLFFLLNSSKGIFDQGCFQRDEMPYSLGIENPVIISDLLVCTHKEIHGGFTLNTLNNSLYIPVAKISLHQFQFLYINESVVRVCSHTYNYIFNLVANLKYADVLGRVYAFFSFACTSVSMLCLLISLVTYCIHSEMRSRPGKYMICLIISLLFAQGTLQFGLKQTGNRHVCIAFGIAIHFSWLWSFFTFCVCTWNVYQTFSSDLATMNRLSQSKDLPIWSVIFMICTPFLVVAGTVTYHMLWSDFQSFGYGGDTCFVSDNITIIVSFIAPAFVIFLVNFIMYSISLYNIMSSAQIRANREKRREFVVYVRLCTLTGITWPLQMVDAALDLTPFSFIATFVNALQGFFIFLSFICNQRVISLYKQMLNIVIANNLHPRR